MSRPDEVTKEIFRAAREGRTEDLVALVGHSMERLHTQTPFGTPLHIASSAGNLKMVEALLALGADIEMYGGTFGGTPLNAAASAGQIEVMKALLSRGASLDVSEPERNPLFGAIYSGHREVVKLLLDAGIDASVRYTGDSMKNMSAVEFAVERGQMKIADLIREHLSRSIQHGAQTDSSAQGGTAA